jgi:hypothetical protein
VNGSGIMHARRVSARRAVAVAVAAAAAVATAAFAAAPAVFAATAGQTATAATATAATTVTCATPAVPVYHVDAANRLRRWSYASPADGGSGWTQAQIGTGWGGLDVISGGDGVIYTVDSSGDLRWYSDENHAGGAGDWDPNSGAVIGTGWGAFTHVFSGGDGVIYAVDSSGTLYWYRYTGTDGGNGADTWAAGSGSAIGTGWGGFTQVFSGGGGIVYAVDSGGGLHWYQYLDPTVGTAGWASNGAGSVVGTGWSRFTQIGSMGAGVIFARDASGGMWWYRHADPLGGSDSWADGGTGIAEGTGWGTGQVVADVEGCTASDAGASPTASPASSS